MEEGEAPYSLQALQGPLDAAQLRHLLDRCLFGAPSATIEALVGKTIQEVMGQLTSPSPELSPPIGISAQDLDVPVGTTWVNASYNINYMSARHSSLHAWWLGNMQQQGVSLTEKMALFAHNHWVTKVEPVWTAAYLYQYQVLLRKHALGNWKQLACEMCINPAMLVFLNGNTNRVGTPNENFARELFELFTIGKGPQLSAGNYTNYTESDVRQAAKVMTGWRSRLATGTSFFDPSFHDNSNKTFSPAFGSKTIDNQLDKEYEQLIGMIFSKKETARFLARKIYRWFTYCYVDAAVETQVIEPLATTLFNNDYEIRPLLVQLLSSEHFFSAMIRGAMIKQPLDFSMGLLRKMELELSPDVLANYNFWAELVYTYIKNMGQFLGEPPDVGGWVPFYQEPDFNELWVNASTIPARTAFTDLMVNTGITRNGFKYQIDPLNLCARIKDAGLPDALISGLAAILFPQPVSAEKIIGLKEILLPGLPDSTWTAEWNKYKYDPGNTTQKEVLRKSLRPLIAAMIKMPEFYLN